MAEPNDDSLPFDKMLPLDENLVEAVLSQFKQRKNESDNLASGEKTKQVALKIIWRDIDEDSQLKG